MRYYEAMKLAYQQAESDGALILCLGEFDARFGEFANLIPTSRKLDFICWAAGKLVEADEI